VKRLSRPSAIAIPALVTLLAACGGSANVSPAAPSGVAGLTSSANASTGAVITGRVTSLSTASTNALRPSADASAFGGPTLAATTSGITVSVVGTGVSTTAGPGGDFTLTGVPSGTVQLLFTSGSASATLTISGVESNDRIEIAVSLNGSNAKVESENRRREDTPRVEVNGRVNAIDLGAGTLQVGTTLVTVPSTATIRHGSQPLTLADITVGDHVEVKGTKSETGIVASEVKVETDSEDDEDLKNGPSGTSGPSISKDNDDDDEDGEDEDADGDHKGTTSSSGASTSELKGTLSGLAGQCPTLTFSVQGVTVTTSSETKFSDVTCAGVKEGMSVEVKGSKTGTTLAATKVEKQ